MLNNSACVSNQTGWLPTRGATSDWVTRNTRQQGKVLCLAAPSCHLASHTAMQFHTHPKLTDCRPCAVCPLPLPCPHPCPFLHPTTSLPPFVPGVGFSSWSALSALTCVRLTGCSGLCDAGLSALAVALAGVLRELQLPGCRGVSDVGVAALSVVTGLRALNLSSNRALTGRCVFWGLWQGAGG